MVGVHNLRSKFAKLSAQLQEHLVHEGNHVLLQGGAIGLAAGVAQPSVEVVEEGI